MALRLLPAALLVLIAFPATAVGTVFYVGDSLGVGTAAQLGERLGTEALTDDVETGRSSEVGVDVLRSSLSPQDDAVVFDLGTNDDPGAPAALAANLAEVARIAERRCIVVATLNRPALNGVSIDGLNRVVVGFARSNPNVELVDWHAIAKENPELLVDGVHSTGEGYALRADLFADALGNCLALGGAPAAAQQAAPGIDFGDGSGTTGSSLPAASAGQNDRVSRDTEKPGSPRREEKPSRVQELADDIGRAVGTGAEFG